jgi:glycosyltransferase involved in cell wall biosynthesis
MQAEGPYSRVIMRLLFVHERFGNLGGAEANARITGEELALRGHLVGLLHGPGTGVGEESWKKAFQDRYPLDETMAALTAEAALAAFRPDVVYVHKMARLDVIGALLHCGRPAVRMVHDHDLYCMKSYKYAYFTRRICIRPFSAYCVYGCGAFVAKDHKGPWPIRYISYRAKKKEIAVNRRFSRMLVVSEYMKQELLRNGFDDARIIILPPIPRGGKSAVQSTFGERNLIVFAGQVIRGKGVDVLLRALALVKSRFECVILGEGSQRAACERLSRKLGLADRVMFKGFVDQDELANYYRECTVVALSSVWPEPIATVGLEVMRCGLPVVAFDAGGIKDWLHDGQNGFLVPWMDHAAFATRLDQLLSDKSLAKQMGARGLELMNRRYSFDKYIEDLERTFSEVLEEHRSSRQRQECANT